ncbi:hypothetical protein BSNK01_18000 [Bacillaceae bacterium]
MFLHEAVQLSFEEAGWHPALFYPTGTLYICQNGKRTPFFRMKERCKALIERQRMKKRAVCELQTEELPYLEITTHYVNPLDVAGEVISYKIMSKSMWKKPDFHLVFRSIVRRLTALLYFYHHGIRIDTDFPSLFATAKAVKLIDADTQWIDWERYSNRQKQRLKMGGIVGKAAYEGDLGAFLPW